ncbi:MAG: PKD domain-containing protein, partial [Thermoplasmata archaeon]|nr:PKD domain-containing protein [Thermoplasmata archaeon]
MAKWLCFVVIAILLIPNIGANEKRMNERYANSVKENDMQHFNDFHHSFFSDFIHRIFMKMKNYAPIALMKSCEGIAGKSIVFDASSSYDANGDALQYRWDFDNDGMYDTKWLSSPTITYAYNKPYNGYVKLQVS